MSDPRRRAVFFDRDDTLIADIPYLSDPGRVRLLPGAREATARLEAAGFLLFIASNQSGIGRGLCTFGQVDAVMNELLRQLAPVRFSGVYYAPSIPGEPSDMRKPAPGMLLRAAQEHGLDLARSWMVGDKPSDVECGRRAGCRTVWLAPAAGAGERPPADAVAESLEQAADAILGAALPPGNGAPCAAAIPRVPACQGRAWSRR